MTTKESIQSAYIDSVLTTGTKPKSVYSFAKQNEMAEQEFYTFYGSFESIEMSIWTNLASTTLSEISAQQVWAGYTSREKALGFYYSFFELAKSKRSFITFSSKNIKRGLSTPRVFEGLKDEFENFSYKIVQDGIESGELADRKLFADRYKDALWMQFLFVLKFWINDNSAGFEKTDEAIEKGVNVTFDLFQRSALDNLFDYAKFLLYNGNIKQKFGF